MNYLIEGDISKVFRLARQSGILDEQNQYRVYASESFPIDDINISSLSSSMNADAGDSPTNMGTYVYSGSSKLINQYPDNSTDFLSVTDFKKALKWCDQYINIGEVEPEHLDMAGKAKKLFTCRNLDFSEDTSVSLPKITYVTGLNNHSGKFSAGFDLASFRKQAGEEVAVICSDRSGYIMECNKLRIPVVVYDRTVSERTFDEELQYYQSLIRETCKRFKCDRIIVIGDSSLRVFSDKNNFNKNVRNLTDIIFVNTIGVDSVVIATDPLGLPHLDEAVKYFLMVGIPIDCIYLNPIKGQTIKLEIDDGLKVDIQDVYSRNLMLDAMIKVKSCYPYVFTYINYMDIQSEFDMWCTDPRGLFMYASDKLVIDAFNTMEGLKKLQSQEYISENLSNQVTVSLKASDFKKVDKDLYKKLLKRIGKMDF